MVVERGDQVEAQAKTRAAVAVTLGQDAKGLQAADDVFDDEPLPRELTISRLLLLRERMMLALLLRQAAVRVAVRQTQVAAVREALRLGRKRQTAFLEQREVLLLAFAEAGG